MVIEWPGTLTEEVTFEQDLQEVREQAPLSDGGEWSRQRTSQCRGAGLGAEMVCLRRRAKGS